MEEVKPLFPGLTCASDIKVSIGLDKASALVGGRLPESGTGIFMKGFSVAKRKHPLVHGLVQRPLFDDSPSDFIDRHHKDKSLGVNFFYKRVEPTQLQSGEDGE